MQKATELGVYKITPLISLRTIPDVKKEKIKRWERIAKEAAKQCGRAYVPIIENAVRIENTVFDNPTIILWERAKSRLKNHLNNIKDNDEINIVVGPEGGFSEEEISQVKKDNVCLVYIGDVILRSETASLYILSVMKFLGEEGWLP